MVKKARVEWCNAGMLGGMCRVRDVCCGGEDAEDVEESAVGRRKRREMVVGRLRRCIVAPVWSMMVGEGLMESNVKAGVAGVINNGVTIS